MSTSREGQLYSVAGRDAVVFEQIFPEVSDFSEVICAPSIC